MIIRFVYSQMIKKSFKIENFSQNSWIGSNRVLKNTRYAIIFLTISLVLKFAVGRFFFFAYVYFCFHSHMKH